MELHVTWGQVSGMAQRRCQPGCITGFPQHLESGGWPPCQVALQRRRELQLQPALCPFYRSNEYAAPVRGTHAGCVEPAGQVPLLSGADLAHSTGGHGCRRRSIRLCPLHPNPELAVGRL